MKDIVEILPVVMSSLGYAIIAYVITFLSTILFLGLVTKKLNKNGAKNLAQGALVISKLIAIGVFLIKLGSK